MIDTNLSTLSENLHYYSYSLFPLRCCGVVVAVPRLFDADFCALSQLDSTTAPSAPAAPPRPANMTSVPALLFSLQNEWDSVVLETFNLRQQNAQLRQELSHALYKEDAAMRVLARVQKERDEARECVLSLHAFGITFE
jgi:hypothetical protein